MQICRLLLGVAILASCAAASAQDYLDTVAGEVCTCVQKVDDNTPGNEVNPKLGVCIVSAMVPYQERVKTDLGIDLNNLASDQASGERLGKVIASRMVLRCPEVLVRISALAERGSAANVEAVVEGAITRVDKEFFVVFSLKDSDGKTIKLYWMSPVSASIDLVNDYEGLVGKTVKVSYRSSEFFDPRVSDYRRFNVITRIQ